MYPVLFRIGDFEITSFGVLAGLVGAKLLWVYAEMRSRHA